MRSMHPLPCPTVRQFLTAAQADGKPQSNEGAAGRPHNPVRSLLRNPRKGQQGKGSTVAGVSDESSTGKCGLFPPTIRPKLWGEEHIKARKTFSSVFSFDFGLG